MQLLWRNSPGPQKSWLLFALRSWYVFIYIPDSYRFPVLMQHLVYVVGTDPASYQGCTCLHPNERLDSVTMSCTAEIGPSALAKRNAKRDQQLSHLRLAGLRTGNWKEMSDADLCPHGQQACPVLPSLTSHECIDVRDFHVLFFRDQRDTLFSCRHRLRSTAVEAAYLLAKELIASLSLELLRPPASPDSVRLVSFLLPPTLAGIMLMPP